jgi:hypothetical protein
LIGTDSTEGTPVLRLFLIVAALGVLIAAAVLEGIRSNRWGASQDLQAAASKLQKVPSAFGDWTGTDNPVDEDILKKAEAVGSISRVYENRKDRTKISILLLCGRSGPIGAHTPDICYAGLGYKMAGRELKQTIGDSSYWTGRFEKPSGEGSLMVSWAWSVDGNWQAADQPRVAFVGHDVLYKLYATRGLTTEEKFGTASKTDPTATFLTDFLPVVKTALESHGAP